LKSQKDVPILGSTQPPRLVPSGIAQPWRLFYAHYFDIPWESKIREAESAAAQTEPENNRL